MRDKEKGYFTMNPSSSELGKTSEHILCCGNDIDIPKCNNIFCNRNRFRYTTERIGCNLGSRTWQTCFKEVVPTKMILTTSGPLSNGLNATREQKFISNENDQAESSLLLDDSNDSNNSCEIIFEDPEIISSTCKDLETSDIDEDDYDDDEDDESSTEDDSCSSDSDSDGDTSCSEDRISYKIKQVTFNLTPVVHTMITWDYAYRAARKGPWEQMARDRCRFKGRINSSHHILDPILKIDHRIRVWSERFAYK